MTFLHGYVVPPLMKVIDYGYIYGPIRFNGDYWIVSRHLPLKPTKLAVIEGIVYEALNRKNAMNIVANI